MNAAIMEEAEIQQQGHGHGRDVYYNTQTKVHSILMLKYISLVENMKQNRQWQKFSLRWFSCCLQSVTAAAPGNPREDLFPFFNAVPVHPFVRRHRVPWRWLPRGALLTAPLPSGIRNRFACPPSLATEKGLCTDHYSPPQFVPI
jgi:hypothetical protein